MRAPNEGDLEARLGLIDSEIGQVRKKLRIGLVHDL